MALIDKKIEKLNKKSENKGQVASLLQKRAAKANALRATHKVKIEGAKNQDVPDLLDSFKKM